MVNEIGNIYEGLQFFKANIIYFWCTQNVNGMVYCLLYIYGHVITRMSRFPTSVLGANLFLKGLSSSIYNVKK